MIFIGISSGSYGQQNSYHSSVLRLPKFIHWQSDHNILDPETNYEFTTLSATYQ